jgi:hypothetical protein
MDVYSGNIASGGVAQPFREGGRNNRAGFFLYNISDTVMYIALGTDATPGAGSIPIPAGGMYESPIGSRPNGTLSVYCEAPGKAYTAGEW